MIQEITDYNVINDELIVLKQNSSKWWVQVKTPPELGLPNNRKRISTKIPIGTMENFYNAVTFGLNLVNKHKVLNEEGIPLFELKPTVKSVAIKVIEEIKNYKIKRKTHNDYIRVIEKEIIPQLGNLYFKDLQIKEIKEFFYNKEAKSQTRTTIAKSSFEKLFDYAIEHKILEQRDKPEINKIKVEVEAPPEHEAFRDSDIELIEENIGNFIGNATNKKSKENRTLFKFYMSLLKTTGIRTGEEATGILWKDLFISKSNKNRIILKICNGKNAVARKIKREICIDQESIENLTKLLYLQTGYNEKLTNIQKNFNVNTDISYGNVEMKHENLISLIRLFKMENKYIFQRKDGKLPNFIDCYNQLSKFLDNRLSGDTLSLYSFRHYFITDRLLNNVEVHQLAKYCGTSVEMITKFYSKVTARMASEHVVKELDLDIFKL